VPLIVGETGDQALVNRIIREFGVEAIIHFAATVVVCRWFVGNGVDDAAWDHSVFSKNRERLLEGDIAAKLLSAVLGQPRVKRLLSTTISRSTTR
jgi:hypothetical protein